MINSFENYLRSGKVKRKTKDAEEARSLLEKSRDRLSYTSDKKITKRTAQFVLEDSYEAAREAAQSLMSSKGFKPYSHEATVGFVKEFYDFNEKEINDFDRFRKIRHDSVYKATIVTINDAKSSLSFAVKFIKKVESFRSF